jgi:dTDP-4-dehydrorhamnose reductase
MRVLILGNKGMLGADLQEVFRDHEVFGWDREEIDISSEMQVDKKVTELKPDVVINSAAYNAVDDAEKNENVANSINGDAVGFLAKTCKKNGIILVHYSTNYVFDGTNKNGYREKDKPNPQSKYAESKVLGEQLLQKFTKKFYLIRTARIFGNPAKSSIAKKSFVNVMIELAGKQSEVKVVDEEYSNTTYSKDLAKRTREILEWKKSYGIYHVTNEGACTWYEFAKNIFEFKGIHVKILPVTSKEFPRPAARPSYSVLVNTKLPPLRKWEDALKEYLGDY